MGIEVVKKVNISEQVSNQLREEILCGNWKPGEKIPSENQLINLLGVSRGTVRQALQKLTGEGLLETRHGEGSFVQVKHFESYFQGSAPLFTLDDEDLREIFEFREMFEGGAAEMAAIKATDEQISCLEENYRRMQAMAVSGLMDEYVQMDLDFHMLLCECTHNTMVTQIYNTYETMIKPSIMKITTNIGARNGLTFHKTIMEAVRDRKPEQAKAAMQEHMRTIMSSYERKKKAASQG